MSQFDKGIRMLKCLICKSSNCLYEPIRKIKVKVVDINR